jgi:hypothetical protein
MLCLEVTMNVRLLFPLLLAACGPPAPTTLTLEAQPPEVPADGVSFTIIRITAQESGRPVQDGTSITLVTDYGSFDKDDPEYRDTSTTVIGGEGQLNLYAPTEPHDATVRGTFTAQSGRTINTEIPVKFREPTLAGRLVFTCNSRNIGALVPNLDDPLAVPCTAKAFDATDTEITRPDIRFLAEAGLVHWVVDEFSGARTVAYKPYAGGSEPKDVPPNGNEPKWSDPESGGRVRNPRDGVVSLVAWVRGIPPGGIDVRGEPFVDANDNGEWDTDEPYHDCNGDLNYDAPTGSPLAKACLWSTFKVVWSGKSCAATPCPAALASRIELQSQTVTCGTTTAPGTLDFTVRLLDRNLNALAANDPQDEMNIDFDGQGARIPSPLLSHAMRSAAGMFFLNTGPDGYLELIRDANLASGSGLETSYSSQIISERPSGAGNIFTLGVRINRTLGPPFEGGSAPDLNTEDTPIAQGQIQGNCPQ